MEQSGTKRTATLKPPVLRLLEPARPLPGGMHEAHAATSAPGSHRGPVMRGQRVIFLVLSHAVIMQTITYGMRPTLSYAVLDAGGAAALLGILAASFAFPALLLALPFGSWVDRVGERSALVLSSLVLIVAALVAALATGSIWLLIVATVLLGIGQVLSAIGQQAMIANARGSGNSDSRFGFYSFAVALGQTIGPLLLTLPGGTVATPPLTLIFLSCAGLGLPMLVLSLLMQSSPRLVVSSPAGMLSTARALVRTPGVVKALLASSIVLASTDLFLVYIPALGHDRGLSAAIVGAMLAVRSVFSMISRLSLGWMVRWIDPSQPGIPQAFQLCDGWLRMNQGLAYRWALRSPAE